MKKCTNWKRVIMLAAGVCFFCLPLAGEARELSLQQAVDMALERNPKVKIALKGQEKAEANLEGAKGNLRPTVTASTSLGISDINDNGSSRNNSNRLQLSLPLYSGGKNEALIDKAEDSVAVSELNVGRTREDLILETVSAYYDILQKGKLVEVNEETVRNYQEHLVNVQDLYAAGSTPKVDLLRSEVALVNAQQELIKAQNSYEVALSTLRNIVKISAAEPVHLSDDAPYVVFSLPMEECIFYARGNRKDLQQSQIAVQQAQKDVEAARSGLRPSVSMSIGNGWDKQILPDGDNHSLSASVSANWNLFDGNVTQAAIKAAQAGVEEAELELEQAKDAVDLEVRQAYLNMREAEKRFHTTEVAVKKAEEDYYIAHEKYRVGEGLMLDVIDAQLALYTAKVNYIQSQYDYVTYKAKLENAMGMDGGMDV